MKRNIAIGIFLIGAMALSSCSTTKLANTDTSDDVYFSNAKAGDEPTYAAADNYNPNATQGQAYVDDDDDYFYYDDYASRINRFSYFSPFSFYDNLYYGYSDPYYNNGFSLGFNYGPWGYGYSPYGYGYGGWGLGYGGWGLGYGWGGYGGYYGGGYWGGGYGGGYPGGYWGSNYFTSGRPRPNRGPGIPFGSGGGRGPINVPGNGTPGRTQGGIGYIPGGRGTNNNYSRPARTDARPSRPGSQQTNADNSRPVTQQQPQYQPQVDRTSTAPSNNSSGGASRSSGGGGGGGGGRPTRP